MTQANLLEQAKSGDPSAIATLMNRTLKPKGITADATRSGDRLIVNLEAAQLPNRQAMATFVQNGILGLKTQAIREIEIHGRQTGDDRSAWVQEILLGMVVDRGIRDQGSGVGSDSLQPPVADPVGETPNSQPLTPNPQSPPPPPPLRPAPPPIPRMQPPDPIVSTEPEPVRPSNSIESEVIAPIEPEPPSPMLQAAVPPGEEIVTAQRPKRARSNLLLPLLVLALLSGLIGAIVGYALWRDRTAPNPTPILPPPSPTPTAAAPTPASPTPASPTSANPLEDAIAEQTQAQALTEAAQSADDWSLVASQWQRSIDLLKSIPASNPNYATAQARLRQAETQLATARERASRPIASAPLPNTTFTVTNEVRCPTNATGGAPVEISSVRFQSGNEIVGCITNNTNQPIANVSIAYQGAAPAESTPAQTPPAGTPPAGTAAPASPAASPASPAAPPSGNSALSFNELPPQRTVPFSGSIAIDPQTNSVTISGINWTPAGASEAQQLPVSVALTR